MSVLDDAARLAVADPSGMLGAVEASAGQWRDGVARARAADLSALPGRDGIDAVVVCGMGGSGVAGDVAACVAAGRAPVPVSVVKGYALPAFAGPRTLVVLASYSGGTEETLACFEQARERGAPVLALATGGRLAELAAAHGAPCLSPPSGLMPRAAFPSLAAIVLVALERAGVLPDLTGDLAETDAVLREQTAACGRDAAAAGNPAKQLAVALDGTVPLVWGQEGPLAVAAARWRTQLNENAKIPAFSAVLPELDHNEVVGYDPGLPALGGVAIVALRAPGEDPRVARRVEATLRLVRPRVGAALEARARGTGDLARLASAVQLGDLVSVYLALLRGVDPTPIEAIARLKSELT